MTRIYIYCLAWIIFFFGCQQKQAPEEISVEENGEVQQIEKEVKELHDLAMKNIEPIMALKSKLKESIGLLKEDPSQVDEVIIREMLVQNLDEARQNMMDWMRSYNLSLAVEDPQNRLKVMTKEKVAIQEVDVQMKDAVRAAKEALEGD